MNRQTIALIAATTLLVAAFLALNHTAGATRPRLSSALKKTTAGAIIVSLAGSVATATSFYQARPALIAYMAAPVIVGVIWTLYRIETASPGRITGLIRSAVGGGRRQQRRTTPRQARLVPRFLPSLRGWLTLAIFEDTLPWRVIHLAALTAAWLTAALLPTPPSLIVPWAITLITTTRWMRVQGERNKIIRRVYAIAASHLDYGKAVNSRLTSGGAAFASPTGCISVEWDDLTNPTRMLVAFPVTFTKTDLGKRNLFEDEFDATLPGAGWKFEWNTSATNVTITVASYPKSVRWEGRTPDAWSIFYIGDELDDGMNTTFDVESESPHVLVAGETGSGKHLGLKSQILTPAGWRVFGDVHTGDQVFAPDGRPVSVVFETKPELLDEYEVIFSDGAVVKASEDHLWFTETRAVRKARSKQKGDYRDAERRQLLHPDVVARLRADAAKAGPNDAVTALDAAMLAGVGETTTWFRDVLTALPVLGQVQEVRDFQYADQEVTQEQTVLRYPAGPALAAFARSWSIKGESRARLEAAMADATLVTVTASEIADLIDVDVKVARRRLWGSGIDGVESVEKVTLKVPAKTVTRKGRRASAYPKAALLLALADAGERFAHDNRDGMATGAVRTTRQIMDTLLAEDGSANHSVPIAKALQFPEADLPVAPYTLGVWLGDGYSRRAQFVGIDHQIARNVEADGYELTEQRPSDAERISQNRHVDYCNWVIADLSGPLKELGVRRTSRSQGKYTKHIPAIYLRASEGQRRSLLAGLLDTDGTVAPQGTVQFTNTNRALAFGTHELALTLGYRATIVEGRATLYGVDHGPKWTVSFTTTDEVFRLDRKNQALRERTAGHNTEKNTHRYIVDVRPTGKQSLMKCIQVDSADHLYLIGDHLIPTHNTEAMFVIAAQAIVKGWNVAICDPKETGWAMWTRRRRPTNEAGHDTGAELLRAGDGRPQVIEHAIELYGIRDVLQRCIDEMQRRKKINGSNKVVKWTELPDEVKEAERIVPLLVVIDEALSLFDMEKGGTDSIKERNEVRGEALGLMQKLIIEARALGIHVLLGIQRPDAAVLGGAMRSNLGARIACGVMEPTGYQMMFQTQGAIPRLVVNDAEGKKVIGRALVRSSPGQPIIPVQVAWLGPGQKDLEQIAPMPADPDSEDETPTGAFNPYVTFDDPTPWLNDHFAGTSTPPWETGPAELEGQSGGAFDAIDHLVGAGAAGSPVERAPWELPPEPMPWEQAGAQTPPWEQPAAEVPPWEQAEPVMAQPAASGESAAGSAWLTPTPAWSDTAPTPGRSQMPAAPVVEDDKDELGVDLDDPDGAWFAHFLQGVIEDDASEQEAPAPAPAPGSAPPVVEVAESSAAEDGWW